MTTVWTPEKIQAAKIKRAATLAAKKGIPTSQEQTNGQDHEENQQSAAVKSRWAAEKATENDLRQLFAQIAIDEGMQLLAKMRQNSEIAAQVLNQRITGDAAREKCKTCDGPMKGRDWMLRRPHRDPTTQGIITDVFCCVSCVALENQKTQGVLAVSDRGMVSSDNPRPQPTDPTAH